MLLTNTSLVIKDTLVPRKERTEYMPKKTDNPIISDEFLDRVVTEINEQYGGPAKEKNDQYHNRDREERS